VLSRLFVMSYREALLKILATLKFISEHPEDLISGCDEYG